MSKPHVCETCGARAPHLYPTHFCTDAFHLQPTPQTRVAPAWVALRDVSPIVGFSARDDWEAERHLAELAMERD